MKIIPSDLPDVVLIDPRVFEDQRGYFFETYQARRYADFVVGMGFVQDNVSFSQKGVVRGLHYQLQKPQGKLVMALSGEIVDVVVDIRQGSSSFGKWVKHLLSSDNHHQLYVPPGFAHGFMVTSHTAIVLYKVTDFYNPGDEYGIIWNDPDLAIDWPLATAVLSDKDLEFPTLKNTPTPYLPRM
jgi:dTDP-4-dehydrorhamnose 3,5-epimerase